MSVTTRAAPAWAATTSPGRTITSSAPGRVRADAGLASTTSRAVSTGTGPRSCVRSLVGAGQTLTRPALTNSATVVVPTRRGWSATTTSGRGNAVRRSRSSAVVKPRTTSSRPGVGRCWAGLRSTWSSSRSMIRTEWPGPDSGASGSRWKRRQISATADSGARCRPAPSTPDSSTVEPSVVVSTVSTCEAGRSPGPGRRSSQRSRVPSGRLTTARSAPARSRLPRMRRPARRAAAADGIRIATRPPGAVCARQCCTQASSGSPLGGTPYSQRASPVSSACPQSRSWNGGSHSTASASSCGKPSWRRLSPAATRTPAAPPSSSRAEAITALAVLISWPSSRAEPAEAAAARSSVPVPQAGSSTVPPPSTAVNSASSVSSAMSRATGSGVADSCRDRAAR